MQQRELLKLAKGLLTLPTAPYHEHRVRDFVSDYCRNILKLPTKQDRAGNVIVRYKRPQAGKLAPLVLVAHMDHPGFEMLDGQRAEFLGGVPKEMFAGARVRLFRDLECGDSSPLSFQSAGQSSDKSEHSIIRATVTDVDRIQWPHRKLLTLNFSALGGSASGGEHGTLNSGRGVFGMWDVPLFRVRDGRLHAAAIDDVLSVVVILATLTEIVRRRSATHVWGAFTRAEEVGFHGAIELAQSRVIPKEALMVSLEMSKERPSARIGSGPVVRVGDRMTTFDATATYFLQEVAHRCRQARPQFQFQRALMDGGTCEATAFAGFGYRAGGLCLPLGNYHNIGRTMRPRAEYVRVDDLEQLVQLTVAAAEQWKNFDAIVAGLSERVRKIRASAPRELRG